ncbi:flagellar basal body-associated FliL family protein [Parvularcula oceani]|uniref:flagellar basal body-associated FliL family protein n=1 Tax=Parvularcula oceani TaxID=1247963 RepID=UPI0004E225BA|nr:flagellar basal body-associated FliL family protein [Parvularcula oceani]
MSEETTPAKRSGLMGTVLLGVVAAAGGFGVVSFATSSRPAVACEAAPEAEAAPEEDAVKPAAASYAALDPFAVALAPDAGARTLRIGIALGLTDDHHSLDEADVLRLKDGFMDDLRAVETVVLTDPAAMPQLRERLLGRARTVLGEDLVAELLITDFLLG